MNELRRLAPYFRPQRKLLIGGLACILMTASIGLLGPLVIGRAIDTLRHEVSSATLLRYGLLLVGLTMLQGVFQFAQRLILVTMSRNVEYDLLNDFFVHLTTLELGFYHKSYTGDLMARATNDLPAVRMMCGPAIMYSANTLFAGLGALALMFVIHPGMTVIALFAMPAIAFVTQVFGQRIHRFFGRVQEQFSTISAKAQENFTGARVVRAYVQEEAENRAFRELNLEYLERQRRLIRWDAAFSPLLQTIIGLAVTGVLWYGGLQMIEGRITIGEFVTFNLYLGRLTWPMIAIGWVINILQRGIASLNRLGEIFDRQPEILDLAPGTAEVELQLDGAIRFHDLDFSYDGEPPVLEDIDLEVAAGTTVAVVGRTGSGKSTLLALVPRLFDPPPETLLVDGADVRDLPLGGLRRAIAMVPQEAFLFSTTVRDNIAYGHHDAGDEQVLRAASLAGLDDDLAAFPDGLDTLVGERGITLSGGQKQRVALARALYREPRILLLDDCLSAVDAHTEERILQNLRTVFPGRTVLLVSHRTSVARMADSIVVLDHGRIAERGSHGELVAAGGIYADLRQRQMLEEELAAV